jgi:hypothetical protein
LVHCFCEDEIEELDNNSKPAVNDDAEDDDEPDPQPMEIDSDDESNFVSYVETIECLGKLQRSAPKLGLNAAATVHLDCFLKALHSSNAKKARLDSTLHSFSPRSNSRIWYCFYSGTNLNTRFIMVSHSLSYQ